MKVSLISEFQKPKACRDYIFELKAEIVKFCQDLAFYKKHDKKQLVYLRTLLSGSRLLYLINSYQYDLHQAIEFDERFYDLLISNAEDFKQGFYLLRISLRIIKETDGYTSKPRQLPPPLYYDNAVMSTLYDKPFWGRVVVDRFGHQCLQVKENGIKYFAVLNPYHLPYPMFTQPFYIVGDIEYLFDRYDTTFEKCYLQMQGFLRMWYGIQFTYNLGGL